MTSINNTPSLDAIQLMLGHSARNNRTEDLKEAGFELHQTEQNKEAVRAEIKEQKQNVENLSAAMSHENGRNGVSKFFSGVKGMFGESRSEKLAKLQTETGLALEKAQKDLTARTAELTSLQQGVKDIHAEFNTSNQNYEDVSQQIEEARLSAIRL